MSKNFAFENCIYFVLQQITEFDLSSSSSQKQQ